jgi:hypothetical protein
MKLGYDNDAKELLQVESDQMLFVIPEYVVSVPSGSWFNTSSAWMS